MFEKAMFASAIPEIVDIFGSRNRYAGRFVKKEGKKHVVVCGDISAASVAAFLADFFHADRPHHHVKAVFLKKCGFLNYTLV